MLKNHENKRIMKTNKRIILFLTLLSLISLTMSCSLSKGRCNECPEWTEKQHKPQEQQTTTAVYLAE